jgi:hypothetical protein
MAMGRPRTFDRNKILADLLEWAKKPTSLNINEFCAWHVDPPIGPRKLSEWSKVDANFAESYDACKAFLAHRREVALTTGELHVKAYDICAPAYDYIIYEQQLNYEVFKSKLKQAEQFQVKEEDNKRFDAIMSQLSSLQSASNQATSNDNKVDKS